MADKHAEILSRDSLVSFELKETSRILCLAPECICMDPFDGDGKISEILFFDPTPDHLRMSSSNI
jgi:hypothetical protein